MLALYTKFVDIGISPDDAKSALGLLRFTTTERKIEAPSLMTAPELKATVNVVKPESMIACIQNLRDREVKEDLIVQAEIFLRAELCDDLECDSNEMLGILLANLMIAGLPTRVAEKCTATVKTKVGEEFPEGDPVLDLLAWGAQHPEHSLHVKSVANYVEAHSE